jgi:hypothetical protein
MADFIALPKAKVHIHLEGCFDADEPRCSKADVDERLEQVCKAPQQRRMLLDRSEQSHLGHRFAGMVFWCQFEEISEEERFVSPPPNRLPRFL